MIDMLHSDHIRHCLWSQSDRCLGSDCRVAFEYGSVAARASHGFYTLAGLQITFRQYWYLGPATTNLQTMCMLQIESTSSFTYEMMILWFQITPNPTAATWNIKKSDPSIQGITLTQKLFYNAHDTRPIVCDWRADGFWPRPFWAVRAHVIPGFAEMSLMRDLGEYISLYIQIYHQIEECMKIHEESSKT